MAAISRGPKLARLTDRAESDVLASMLFREEAIMPQYLTHELDNNLLPIGK